MSAYLCSLYSTSCHAASTAWDCTKAHLPSMLATTAASLGAGKLTVQDTKWRLLAGATASILGPITNQFFTATVQVPKCERTQEVQPYRGINNPGEYSALEEMVTSVTSSTSTGPISSLLASSPLSLEGTGTLDSTYRGSASTQNQSNYNAEMRFNNTGHSYQVSIPANVIVSAAAMGVLVDLFTTGGVVSLASVAASTAAVGAGNLLGYVFTPVLERVLSKNPCFQKWLSGNKGNIVKAGFTSTENFTRELIAFGGSALVFGLINFHQGESGNAGEAGAGNATNATLV